MANQGSDRVQRVRRLRMALSNKATKNSGERIERIFDSPKVITVGTSENCTFRVQKAPCATGSFALIVPENGKFRLQIANGMKGWIILTNGENKTELFPAPTSDSRFETFDDGCAVTLLGDSRGKVSIGSDSILFQVVEEEISLEDTVADASRSFSPLTSEVPHFAHLASGSAVEAVRAPAKEIAAPVKNPSESTEGVTDLSLKSLILSDASLREAKDRAQAAHEAWQNAKIASEDARHRVQTAQAAKEQAHRDMDALEAEIQALKERLLAMRETVREAEVAQESAQATLREREALEDATQAEASNALELAETAQRERERLQEEEMALQRRSQASTLEAEASMEYAVESSEQADDEEDEDDGPLVLPTYEDVTSPRDYLFSAVIIVACILNFGLLTAIRLVPMPEPKELTLEDIPERFAQVIIPEKPKDEPVMDEAPQKVAEVETKSSTPAKEEKSTAPAAIDSQKFSNKEERRAAIREGVQGKGLLKLLGALGGDGGDSDAIQDVLGGGSDSSNDIASALMGASGVGVATSESIAKQAGQRMGGGSGEAATIGDLGTKGGASAEQAKITEKKAVVITGRVIDEGPELESSDCDRNAIARYVRGRMKAIQNCYERELKKNPSLKGKIVVRFTIDEQGKVTDFSIEEETIGNTAVIACIRNTIRVWRFPIKDNECPVAYPFIFAPSS